MGKNMSKNSNFFSHLPGKMCPKSLLSVEFMRENLIQVRNNPLNIYEFSCKLMRGHSLTRN